MCVKSGRLTNDLSVHCDAYLINLPIYSRGFPARYSKFGERRQRLIMPERLLVKFGQYLICMTTGLASCSDISQR